ncbi:hypothetical protein NE865_13097 [Phthorimaea operculella]|nr:hypothetical protein NE865_13097 [Phthorimaea operculella]
MTPPFLNSITLYQPQSQTGLSLEATAASTAAQSGGSFSFASPQASQATTGNVVWCWLRIASPYTFSFAPTSTPAQSTASTQPQQQTGLSLGATAASTAAQSGGSFSFASPQASQATTAQVKPTPAFGAPASTAATSLSFAAPTGGLNFSAPASSAPSGLPSFGATTTPASTAGLPSFGTPASTAPTSTGLPGFGATSGAPTSTGIKFGTPASTVATATGLPSFGAPATTSAAPTGLSFGTPASTATTTSAGLSFGTTPASSAATSLPSFGATTSAATATSATTGLSLGATTGLGFGLKTATTTATSSTVQVSSAAKFWSYDVRGYGYERYDGTNSGCYDWLRLWTEDCYDYSHFYWWYISLGKSSAATLPTLSTATTTTAAAAPPQPFTQISFAQLEENINKWTLELEEQEKTFINQATQINAWDRLLIANGEKIVELNDAVETVKNDQQSLEHELDFVLAQQKELEDLLAPMEKQLLEDSGDRMRDPEREHISEHEVEFVLAQQKELEDLLAPMEKQLLEDSGDRMRDPEREHISSSEHELYFVLAQQNELEDLLAPMEKQLLEDSGDRMRDPEREHMYSLAENLDTQLRQMSEDLKEVIEHLNETNRSQDSNDPIVQIGRILNAHMSSMQWIDNSIAQIAAKLDQLKATHDTLRKDNERSFNLTYN